VRGYRLTWQRLTEEAIMEPEMIIALDVPSTSEISPVIARMPASVGWYKVGLELFVADGERALVSLADQRKHVFLDLKLHDIPNTVAAAVRAACRRGVGMLTVHAHGGRDMLRAATEAAAEAGPTAPLILAVTTLTSLSEQDLRGLGIARTVSDHTAALADLAVAAGVRGLVCSVHEAAVLRARLGSAVTLVTPGIRPSGAALQDQKRVATPTAAVKAGANFLVVGRPVLAAVDMGAAASAILAEIAAAHTRRHLTGGAS
jgi:orotidine-5'-phosphate decarboxylase